MDLPAFPPLLPVWVRPSPESDEGASLAVAPSILVAAACESLPEFGGRNIEAAAERFSKG